MIRLFFSFIFLMCNCFSVNAQQLPQFTQWSLHQLRLNPAHAGIKDCADLHVLYRMQWVGFDGAPNTGFFTASLPITTKGKNYLSARQGLALKFETDKIGQFSTNRFNLGYASHFNFNKEDRLSLGIYAGALQTGYDPTNTVLIENDPTVTAQSNFLSPDASFGAWYNTTNYYVGLSLLQLIPSKWKDIGNDSRYKFHTAITGGYKLKINDNFHFLPAAIIRVPAKGPVSMGLNAHFDYKDLITLGLGYRNTDALMVIAQFKINGQFVIAYSFDYTTSSIQSASSNTHELSLQFTTCKKDRTTTTGCSLFE